MLWDVSEGKKLYSLEANETIHALCFSPNRYWLCAATDSNIKVLPFDVPLRTLAIRMFRSSIASA